MLKVILVFTFLTATKCYEEPNNIISYKPIKNSGFPLVYNIEEKYVQDEELNRQNLQEDVSKYIDLPYPYHIINPRDTEKHTNKNHKLHRRATNNPYLSDVYKIDSDEFKLSENLQKTFPFDSDNQKSPLRLANFPNRDSVIRQKRQMFGGGFGGGIAGFGGSPFFRNHGLPKFKPRHSNGVQA